MASLKQHETVHCGTCGTLMQRTLLPMYEFEEGFPLNDVEAYQCPKCREVYFTEKDAQRMEERTEKLERAKFGFDRKITISGGSMVVSIPHELAQHLKLRQGQTVRVVPLSKEGFFIKKKHTSRA